jgi:hypothetical protein
LDDEDKIELQEKPTRLDLQILCRNKRKQGTHSGGIPRLQQGRNQKLSTQDIFKEELESLRTTARI